MEDLDVVKIVNLINSQKPSTQNEFQSQVQDYISCQRNFEKEIWADDDLSEEENIEDSEILGLQDAEDDFETWSLGPDSASDKFSNEEQTTIDSCCHPDLRRLLVFNRLKNGQLMNMFTKVKGLLLECRQNIHDKKVSEFYASEVSDNLSSAWKLAAPYFKDASFFASPYNSDIVLKKLNKELSVYDVTQSPKWTPVECDKLICAVLCNYNINRQKHIIRRLHAIKGSDLIGKDEIGGSDIDEICTLNEELNTLKKSSQQCIPPINSNDFIDWYRIAEMFLRDKHTASECKSMWFIYLHPHINKLEWDEEESNQLLKVASHYLYQKWDTIANDLNNKRTGFTTCLHYFSNMCEKLKRQKFSNIEDNDLLIVVDSYKIGSFIPWDKVAQHFTDRSRHQLYYRYTYFLSQNHVKKGKFSEAEDILLLVLVDKFGKNFRKCSEYMPHRSQTQLKSRYNSNLRKIVKKGTFTEIEDNVIMEHVNTNGEGNWSTVAEKLSRSRSQVRQRYGIIRSFLTKHSNLSLRNVPKRKHTDGDENQLRFLRYMASEYRHAGYIPSLSMIEEVLGLKTQSSQNLSSSRKCKQEGAFRLKNIDNLLINLFCNSLTNNKNRFAHSSINEAICNVKEILSILGITLNIPNDFKIELNLDDVDEEILKRIDLIEIRTNTGLLSKQLAPNLMTAIGIKHLIIKHKEEKKNARSIFPLTQQIFFYNNNARSEEDFHQKMFCQRFLSLFCWGSILSLQRPNLQNTGNSVDRPVDMELIHSKI